MDAYALGGSDITEATLYFDNSPFASEVSFCNI